MNAARQVQDIVGRLVPFEDLPSQPLGEEKEVS